MQGWESVLIMNYFPAFLDLNGRRCLLVGGGEVAARKLRLLRKAGAAVTVVAPEAVDEIADLAEAGAEAGQVTLIRRGFAPSDLGGHTLVIGATGIAALDEQVAEAAHGAGVPVNVVDRVDLSSFIVPAIVDRDPVTVAIGTAGTAPVLARRIREQIESLLPARLGCLARFAGSFRGAVRANFGDGAARRRFWERFFDGPIAGLLLAGDERGARERMLALVNGRVPGGDAAGSVAIVGAGPGDPDLLTVRALRLMQQADLVVYDRLIGPAILDYVRRDAERIHVGKARGHHSRTQDEINALMLRHARAGRRVVRLKGGDPFMFGRGGEELAYLRRHGVAVELVPGITAATGCAASAGIPLTHRDHAQAATFVTAQAKDGEPDLDWAALARLRQTLVIYMGVSAAGRIAARLIEHGLAPPTPAAVVENGTLPDQKVAIGSIGDVETLIRENNIRGPAVIIVGDVVRLADSTALPIPAPALAV
jgi:uroporphyrin-III C-methyltransferase/precorrin-2 dehydrogenase/sirohydrochlorin ferrochelatase